MWQIIEVALAAAILLMGLVAAARQHQGFEGYAFFLAIAVAIGANPLAEIVSAGTSVANAATVAAALYLVVQGTRLILREGYFKA
jgi:hypothetical protein